MGTYASTVINKICGVIDKNLSQLVRHGATFADPIGILFEGYSVVPCYNFKNYISRQDEDYLDGILGSTFNHEELLTRAMSKYDYLHTKGMWGAKSPDKEKIVAMSATLTKLKGELKGKLKLDDKMANIKKGGGQRQG